MSKVRIMSLVMTCICNRGFSLNCITIVVWITAQVVFYILYFRIQKLELSFSTIRYVCSVLFDAYYAYLIPLCLLEMVSLSFRFLVKVASIMCAYCLVWIAGADFLLKCVVTLRRNINVIAYLIFISQLVADFVTLQVSYFEIYVCLSIF